MKQILTFLTSIAVLSTIAFPIASGFAQMWSMSATTASNTQNPLTPPKVTQPSDEQARSINKQFRWGSVQIFNGSREVPINQTIVANGDNVYVAWIGKSGAGNTIYLSASHNGGRNFTSPIQIKNSTVGAASHLVGCASGNQTSYAWEQPTGNGKTEIWGVISMDQGQNFIRNQLSSPGQNATALNPIISAGNCENVLYTMTYNNGTTTLNSWPW